MKLSCYEFGRQLLETKDLDPVYILLWEAKLPEKDLLRWLLAYWCFYHVGTASWISDRPKIYWQRMHMAAASKEYPRAHERRHFRGKLATTSVAWLQEQGLDELFYPLLCRGPTSLEYIVKQVKQWHGFGDWIAFKVADMLERLYLVNPASIWGSPKTVAPFLFKSPREGAELLWAETNKTSVQLGAKPNDLGEWAASKIIQNLQNQPAPPRYERRINAMEAETILCKWHSYMGGHYEIGEDIKACRSGLLRFAFSQTSQKLIQAGKAGGLW